MRGLLLAALLAGAPAAAQDGEPAPKRLSAIRKDLSNWPALKARSKALGDRLLEVHSDRADAKARVGQLWGMLESIEAQIKARRRKIKEAAAEGERERRLDRKEVADALAKAERLEKLQLYSPTATPGGRCCASSSRALSPTPRRS